MNGSELGIYVIADNVSPWCNAKDHFGNKYLPLFSDPGTAQLWIDEFPQSDQEFYCPELISLETAIKMVNAMGREVVLPYPEGREGSSEVAFFAWNLCPPGPDDQIRLFTRDEMIELLSAI